MNSDPGPSLAAAVKLSETLDLAAAPSLAETFLGLRGKDVIVDASGVLHLAASCAQVLMSALATWRADSRKLTFVEPTFAFAEGGRLLGISHLLNDED